MVQDFRGQHGERRDDWLDAAVVVLVFLWRRFH